MTDGFAGYPLPDGVREKLEEDGIRAPLPVQEETRQDILAQADLLVGSPTGSGKTLAYLLPLFCRVDPAAPGLQALVVVPTRELAAQVHQVALRYRPEKLRSVLLIGGTSRVRQKKRLRPHPHLAVGTPGTLSGAFADGRLRAGAVRLVVVDEADKLADERFRDEVESLLQGFLQDPSVQFLFFSATVTRAARDLLERFQRSYRDILLGPGTINEDLRHVFFMARDDRKYALLGTLRERMGIGRAVIFITRNAGVAGLARRLQEDGWAAGGIHSGLSAQQREGILARFHSGKVSYLVTTDILARGMDFSGVDHVIHYDLPKSREAYVHRSGRTARAGRPGTVITFVEEEKKFVIRKYEKELGIRMQEQGIDPGGRIVEVRYPQAPGGRRGG